MSDLVSGPDWFDRVPKVELHLHLEGAIPLDVLWSLVQKYGGDPSVPDLAALEARFVYRDFGHFLQTWTWKTRFLRELEDFTTMAEAVARALAKQNVRYVEMFYSPVDFAFCGLGVQELTAAIRAGLDKVDGVEVALIVDLVRDAGPIRGATTLRQVAEVKEFGVIGIGIGGSEGAFPPGPFAGVYEEARRLGFHTTAHAGEVCGPESIWEALRELRVERLGHGTSAIEDEALLEHLARTRIPLETCPGSNVCTGGVPRLAEHPVGRFLERGLLVTVNTDDPTMFGLSLAGEYRGLCAERGFGHDTIRGLILSAVDASWLSPEGKAHLRASLESDPDWLGS